MSAPVCPYCGKPARLVGGVEIFPNRTDLHDLNIWSCKPCGARVGCHPGTVIPLGTLANADLRRARIEAHGAFDQIWDGRGGTLRSEAYSWLANELGVAVVDCHIGMFSLETCQRVIEICREKKP